MHPCLVEIPHFSTYRETVLSVSLLWVVPKPYRHRQELHLHLELNQIIVVEKLGYKGVHVYIARACFPDACMH